MPSGAITTVSRSAARTVAATSLAKPLAVERFTGIPPSQRMKMPSGQRNSVCLPTNLPPSRSASFACSPTRKSQFEVCGATISTILRTSGTPPSKRQPVSPMLKRPSAALRRECARSRFGPSRGTWGSLQSATALAGSPHLAPVEQHGFDLERIGTRRARVARTQDQQRRSRVGTQAAELRRSP